MSNKPTIYFGNFPSSQKLKDIVPVAITSGIPTWYHGLRYKALAPEYQLTCYLRNLQKNNLLTKKDIADITKQYIADVLVGRTPDSLFEEIEEVCGSDKFCLISYESAGEFSHRDIIKIFFEQGGYSCVQII